MAGPGGECYAPAQQPWRGACAARGRALARDPGGAARDYPPIDAAGFLDFARSLPTPVLYDAIHDAAPITSIFGYRRTENVRRYYEKLPLFLEGLITLGMRSARSIPSTNRALPLPRLVPAHWTRVCVSSADCARLAT